MYDERCDIYDDKQVTEVDICALIIGVKTSAKKANYKGIELTEEWLKRFDVDYNAINESYRGRYLQLTITGVTYFFFTDTNTLERDSMPIKIEFVHQFQNLTFALTGTDLVLKE